MNFSFILLRWRCRLCIWKAQLWLQYFHVFKAIFPMVWLKCSSGQIAFFCRFTEMWDIDSHSFKWIFNITVGTDIWVTSKFKGYIHDFLALVQSCNSLSRLLVRLPLFHVKRSLKGHFHSIYLGHKYHAVSDSMSI